MTNIPSELKKAIITNNLVIFAGAGLSARFNLPSWNKLVEDVIKEIDKKEFNVFLPVLEMKSMDSIDVLEKLKSEHTKIKGYIKDKFKIKSGDFTLHKKLLDLSGQIITTNYDNAFESASNNSITPSVYTSSFNISQINKNGEQYIFKIHGSYTEPDNCILFKEDYDKLYLTESAAKEKLKSIFAEKTILFLGFSFNDPDINLIFERLDEAFGNNNKHFVLTKESDKFAKFKFLETIPITEYNQIDSHIDLFKKIKEENKQIPIDEAVIGNTVAKVLLPKKQEKPSICILCPYPIEKIIEYNLSEIANEFKSFDVIVDIEYLSIENIRELKPYDYILVFTHSLKNKLLVEDEFLKSKYISINNIEENIDTTSIKHISILYYGEILSIEVPTSIPHILVNLEKGKFKEILKSYIYKLFKKADLSIIQQSFVCSQPIFKMQALNKGISKCNIHRPLISKYIDQKLLTKFVGRKTDLENIIRKIIENQFNSTLLTIKASGGIGKTTIICKAAIELANRKYFLNGIHFISCHSIYTFENFYYQISNCFNLANSSELLSQIKENIVDKSRLIILDNFETILNIPESDKIIELVTFLIDYSTIVVTTRQLLELEFEDVYDLRNFTTEEGVLLFKTYYTYVKPDEEKILKEQIVEKILNNNPLAIKLIAKGLVNAKDLFQLKEELEENIFKDEDLGNIFEKPEDYNIEKSVSLYQSINYSYQRLTENEKLTFELLSLFPDGIHLENFKKFIKQAKNKKLSIGEKEIKSLDNKSLLENSNAFLKLQSIISRFADYQFMQKEEHLKKDFFTVAYSYNRFFLEILDSNLISRNLALKIQDANTNNYLKIIDNIELVDVAKEEKLLFIDDVGDIFRITNQKNELIKRENRFHEYFEDVDGSKLLIESMMLLLEFWTTNFNQPLEELLKIIPIDSINENFYENEIKRRTALNAFSIYSNCGFEADIVKHRLQTAAGKMDIYDSLFTLGYIEETKNVSKTKNHIFVFENKQIHHELTLTEIDKYLTTCHPKDTVEIIQINYIKLKYFGFVSKKEISKMVVSNPYTKGLISLMLAIVEKDKQSKKAYFKEAIELLKQIKYYYVDSIINYCQFLKEIEDNDFSEWLDIGLKEAKNHKYRYLYHILNCMKTGVEEEYSQDNYEQIVPYAQILAYIKEHK